MEKVIFGSLNESSIVDLIYPVGSIYMSVASTSPEVLFGGTWVKLEDRFLVGSSTVYPLNDTGGSLVDFITCSGTVGSHTLTNSEIPVHSHSLNAHKHGMMHYHGVAAHTHSVPSHTHGLNSHTHTINTHSHGLNGHTHTYDKSAATTGGNSGNTSSTTIYFSNGHAEFSSDGATKFWRHESTSVTWAENARFTASAASTNNSNHTWGTILNGSQAHTHTHNAHTHAITLTSTNTGGNSGNTAGSGTLTSNGPSTTNTASNGPWTSGSNTDGTVTTAPRAAANSTTEKSETDAASGSTDITGGGGGHDHSFTGGSVSVHTVPPYLAVNMWKRTA